MLHYVLDWKLSEYVCVSSDSIYAIYCVLHIADSSGTVISLPIPVGKRHPVYGDGILDSILTHFESIWGFGY